MQLKCIVINCLVKKVKEKRLTERVFAGDDPTQVTVRKRKEGMMEAGA